jgi:hypothetical protein
MKTEEVSVIMISQSDLATMLEPYSIAPTERYLKCLRARLEHAIKHALLPAHKDLVRSINPPKGRATA